MDWNDVGNFAVLGACTLIYGLINISVVGLILVTAIVLKPVSPRISMLVTVCMATLLLIFKVVFWLKFLPIFLKRCK